VIDADSARAVEVACVPRVDPTVERGIRLAGLKATPEPEAARLLERLADTTGELAAVVLDASVGTLADAMAVCRTLRRLEPPFEPRRDAANARRFGLASLRPACQHREVNGEQPKREAENRKDACGAWRPLRHYDRGEQRQERGGQGYARQRWSVQRPDAELIVHEQPHGSRI